MINYTTPTIALIVENIDLTGKDIYVTLEQGKHELTKSGAELTVTTQTEEQITDTHISFKLTQWVLSSSIFVTAFIERFVRLACWLQDTCVT